MPCDFRVLIKANPSFVLEKHEEAPAEPLRPSRALPWLEAHAFARARHIGSSTSAPPAVNSQVTNLGHFIRRSPSWAAPNLYVSEQL
jgi:hypothetical protein